jgi:tRNA-2-methylthio-N6-dimethylallyladenosine synthase
VIERHLHLPLQSGSNQILKQMNRHYTREHYLEIVKQARALIPGLSLSTDIIVGFPGETDEDFAATLDLIEQVKFDSAFTFQFSRRTGTPAATMINQVEQANVTERFNRLVTLLNAQALSSHEQMVGTVVEVLIEGSSDTSDDILTGRNSQNQLINITVPDHVCLPDSMRLADGRVIGHLLEGSLARVRITRAKTFSLEGIMEDWQP